MSENDCKYVSSRGIMKSCKVYSTTPISSIRKLVHYNFGKLEEGEIVYICSSAIPEFSKLINRIHCPFILVTGDCDESCPVELFGSHEQFLAFIEHPKIIRWYSQNCVGNHPKLFQIPIGLDYHTMAKGDHAWGRQIGPSDQEGELVAIATSPNTPSRDLRHIRAYSNFHFSMNTKFAQDRRDAIAEIPPACVFYEPRPVTRSASWTEQAKYTFVVSPHGNGLDCHRTWEALVLGCIPIVKTSPLDPLFDGLPVWIVKKWSDVSKDAMIQILEDFRGRIFTMDKLTLEYWMKHIVAKS